MYARRAARIAAGALLIGGLTASAAACASEDPSSRVEPVYDNQTGRLQLLKYDANSDGRVDTWSYMEGSRVVRVEIDSDHNAVIDRWEYYSPDERLEKVGSSRARDGQPDTWAFYGGDGAITRLELSLKRDGLVDRIEYYERGVVARAEEDTNRDGRVDKWETYDGARLASVAFDTASRGYPDRRLVYGPDGKVKVEALSEPAAPRP